MFVPRADDQQPDGIPKGGRHHALNRPREHRAAVRRGAVHRLADAGHGTRAPSLPAGVLEGLGSAREVPHRAGAVRLRPADL